MLTSFIFFKSLLIIKAFGIRSTRRRKERQVQPSYFPFTRLYFFIVTTRGEEQKMKWFSRKLKLSLQLPSLSYLTSIISWQVEARLNHFAPRRRTERPVHCKEMYAYLKQRRYKISKIVDQNLYFAVRLST